MKSINSLQLTPLAISLATLTAASVQVQAQEDVFALEEIVVTAQKREESLQDVPISVSAMSGEKIAEVGIPGLQDFAAYIPNLNITTTAISDVVSIRGIQAGAQAGFELSVGTFSDGIYRGRSVQSRFSFLDVGMIEVLRGPQSTLFGKNTIGGALNIRSAAPTEEFEAEISAFYEVEHDELEYKGYVSGPLNDQLRGRFAFQVRELDDGWVDNEGYNEQWPEVDEWAARGSLEWDAGENTLVKFKYEHGDWDNGGGPFDEISSLSATPAPGPVNDFKTNVSNSGAPAMDRGSAAIFDGDTSEFALQVDHTLESGSTFTTILGYSEYEFDRLQDVDFSSIPFLQFDEFEDYEQTSLEARLVSDRDDGFNYIVGIYYQDNELFTDALTAYNTAIISPVASFSRYGILEQDSESWAAFTQGSWDLSDTVQLTIGLRYGEEEKDAEQSMRCAEFGVRTLTTCSVGQLVTAEFTPHVFDDLKLDEEDWTYSVNLSWDVTEDTMLYATVSTGTKSGGFNSFALTDVLSEAEYDQEEVKSYEIGAKMTLADGAAELNIAIFDMDYENLQASVFTGTAGFVVKNVGSAGVSGVELDGRWRLTETLTLSGSLGYLDFEYEEFPNAGCTAAQIADPTYTTADPVTGACIQDLKGEAPPITADYSGALSLEHEIPIGDFFLRSVIDVNYLDDHSTTADADPIVRQDSYTLTNLTFTFGAANGKWDVSLIGRNITDEEYMTYTNDVPLTTAANGSGGPGSNQVGTQGRPANYAIRGRLRF
ncbi:TonB-dependent receptor [Maricurvus nonylphenolicus]|uniref:TonB-dependent receptor n=1 Tax=Maricurvus nonylphenolicus TaxID=1008307 RepID=UPI0036F3E105